ncbi:MAG: hypothetical protein JO316_00460 [Abitibacteriaceae bacterium]|nr:hypothetical protein [Abditibacteriaceae bacterium]
MQCKVQEKISARLVLGVALLFACCVTSPVYAQLPPQGSLPAGQLPPGSGYLPAGQLPGSPGTRYADPKSTTPHQGHTVITSITIMPPLRVPHLIPKRHPLVKAPRHPMPPPPLPKRHVVATPTTAAALTPGAAPAIATAAMTAPSLNAPAQGIPDYKVGIVYTSNKDGFNFHSNGQNNSFKIPQLAGLAPGNTPHTITTWVKVPALPAAGRAWMFLL